MKMFFVISFLGAMAMTATAWAASKTVTMRTVDKSGTGQVIGLIVFTDSAKGLKVTPNLRGLSEGQHGTHVHQNPDCGPAEKDGKMVPGLAAGSHFDPKDTGKHLGPAGDGHLGDLPVVYVGADGRAERSGFAPRLTTADLKGRAIVIHAGGDNYSDLPKPLGGGGSRVACGVVAN